MSRLSSGVLAGMIAGAAGATALNLVSYGDQAIRARPAADTPGRTVNALCEVAGVDVPGGPSSVKTGSRVWGRCPVLPSV
ncbi:MAG: hypothetical protein M3Y42_03045 [Actinomycetota bacterium]|nr:hypothetical protein [Actinomycetota bacterium]MDQ2955924.1 hypothetical protein [Actinomycetota bacterium]